MYRKGRKSEQFSTRFTNNNTKVESYITPFNAIPCFLISYPSVHLPSPTVSPPWVGAHKCIAYMRTG